MNIPFLPVAEIHVGAERPNRPNAAVLARRRYPAFCLREAGRVMSFGRGAKEMPAPESELYKPYRI
jgi:hypothetical protein